MNLTNEYRFIAKSDEIYGHGTPQSSYRYRLILHAKYEQAAGAAYRVWLRTYMITTTYTPFSCTGENDVESYASAGGIKGFSKTTGPNSGTWGTSVAGEDGAYSNGILLGEGYVDIDGSDGASHSVELVGYWKKVSYTVPSSYAGIPYHTTVAQAAATVTLPALAVASTISASSGYFGNVIPITISRFDSVYTHTITASCAGVTETILENSTSYPTVNWTPAVASYAPKIVNAMSANCALTCSTYRYGVLVGTKTANITLSLQAEDVKPSTAITIEDAAGYRAKYGKFVATKSKLKISLTNALPYGATVKTVSITANGAAYSSNPVTTNELLSETYSTITAKVQDSRAQWSEEASAVLDILPYAPPAIVSFSIHRCTSDGTADEEGAYCRADYDVSISPLDNNNSRSLSLKYKTVAAEEYTSAAITLTSYCEAGSTIFAADTEQSFDVVLALTDDFSTTEKQTRLSTAATMMALKPGGLAVGFGKVPEHDKAVELAEDWMLYLGSKTLPEIIAAAAQQMALAAHPVGSVYISSDPTDPGTLFGGTWERIKDVFVLATGDTYAIGAAGGAASVTLTTANMPSHQHTFTTGTAGAHEHLSYALASGSGTWGVSQSSGTNRSPSRNEGLANGYTANAGGHQHTGTTDASGSGTAVNKMPPYITRYMWERTA